MEAFNCTWIGSRGKILFCNLQMCLWRKISSAEPTFDFSDSTDPYDHRCCTIILGGGTNWEWNDYRSKLSNMSSVPHPSRKKKRKKERKQESTKERLYFFKYDIRLTVLIIYFRVSRRKASVRWYVARLECGVLRSRISISGDNNANPSTRISSPHHLAPVLR